MDPNKLLYDIVDNLLFLQVSHPVYSKETMLDARIELGQDLMYLADWINKGGFIPTLKVYIKD